jgi:acetylornithine deacetylase/succinyl-diaminopimelate desuccinylase-like protein
MSNQTTTATDYLETHHERFLDELMSLVEIPSISTQPQRTSDVRRVATWLHDRLVNLGLDATLLEHPDGNHPLVYARYHVKDSAPTVLLYGHYDVQPAVLEDGWDTEPFKPVIKGDKLYGRGTADSKVNVMSQLAALEALMRTDSLDVNVIVAFEGEEESGGATIAGLLADESDKFAADIAVICDGSVIDAEYPSLPVGLRGIITMELEIQGPIRDVHSGQFGGTLHNPLQALCELIATFHDETGKVSIAGFYDDVRTLSEEERARLAVANAQLEETWQQVAAAPAYWGEPGYNVHERSGVRPTLEINGIRGGYAEEGFKTVIPSRALAKVSCRLVADQDPEDIFAKVSAHVRQHTPNTVKSELRRLDAGSPAVLLATDAPAVATMKDALEANWQHDTVFELVGGSVPIASLLKPHAKDMVFVGFAHRGAQVHGPNEHIFVDNYYKGMRAMLQFLQACA